MAKKSLNEKLLLLVKMKGLTQTEVAKDVGMQPSHINRYFSGASDLTTGHFIEILKTLGIDLDKIVTEEFQKQAGTESVEIDGINSSVTYLLNSLDEIGRQTALKNLLWMAQTYVKANGHTFPKNVETQIKREISLI